MDWNVRKGNDDTERFQLNKILADIQNTTNDTRDSQPVFIGSPSDFPEAVAGVRTLEDNTTYFITRSVDLLGDRLVCGENTAIIGGSSENCILSSTGLVGVALITSQYSLPMRHIGITANVAVNLSALLAEYALDWDGVNFRDCPTIGTISGYSNFIAINSGFLNSAGLTFDNSFGTVGFSGCIFNCSAGGTVITVPSTAVVSRRFRIIYSAFIVLAGETGINLSTSASLPPQGYILDTVSFSGGGTYTSGVPYSDNKSLFVNNQGIQNSAELSYMTMNGNATATTISSTGVAVKVAGVTVSSGITQRFTNTNNRATYSGAISRAFKVSATLSCISGNNHQIGVYIAKNGTEIAESESYITTNGTGRAEQAKVQVVTGMITGDYVEVFVENQTAVSNITVTELSVIVEALN